MNAKTKSDPSPQSSPNPSAKPTSPTSKPRAKLSAADGSARPSSVPISVYRELAAELKNTKVLLEAVTAQNQQLLSQNQQIRQEAAQILAATQSLQALVQTDVAPPVLTPDASASTSPSASPTAPSLEEVETAGGEPSSKLASDGDPPQTQPSADEQIAAALHRVFAVQVAQASGSDSPNGSDSPHGEAIANSRTVSKTLHAGKAEVGHHGQATHAPHELSNFWLILTVIVVIITAFGAGFLMVLPFIQQQPNSNR
ncbi:MAG: hypothetical protein ACFB8W_14990 [Elainellaceae cyanobacterium]